MNGPDANSDNRLDKLLKTLGPGLIFAGTSIGVSHIVQSTRAGAVYGFGLILAVILANLFKYPFFEYGPRYTVATGEHLLHGYRRVGRWAFYLFCGLSLCTMFPIQAAVTLVTTGLLANLLSWPFPPVVLSAVLLTVCCVILLAGRYPLLDKLMKIMILFLGVSTITAFAAALMRGPAGVQGAGQVFSFGDERDVAFLVALVGWMPTTLEISVWHSFWCAERIKQTGHRPSLRHALFDFHLGYWGTMIMALFFLGLGALVMYATGKEFSGSAVTFTGQVIELYTEALGPWSKWVIGVAAATTMFSTTICCLDAFPRVIREVCVMVNPALEDRKEKIYLGAILIVAAVSTVIIGCFVGRMKALIDFATTLAFLATPVFAYINLRTVTAGNVPVAAQPNRIEIAFSWFCLAVLTGFALLFVYSRFF
ncbi:MAG: Nramp family divalent metal transporter [Candidatus Omnitrophica bacterium]|nr:Nramp family divalent metal transporter [Candidatus Omnitrophota bacterium]